MIRRRIHSVIAPDAGGDWNKIAPIIEEELRGEDHTLVVLPEGGGK